MRNYMTNKYKENRGDEGTGFDTSKAQNHHWQRVTTKHEHQTIWSAPGPLTSTTAPEMQ